MRCWLVLMIQLVLCCCLSALPPSVNFECLWRYRTIRQTNMKTLCDVLNMLVDTRKRERTHIRFCSFRFTYTYRKVKFTVPLEFAHARQMNANNSQPKQKQKTYIDAVGPPILTWTPTRHINNSRTITNTIVVASSVPISLSVRMQVATEWEIIAWTKRSGFVCVWHQTSKIAFEQIITK